MTNKINRRVVAAIAAAAMLGGWQLAQAADKIRIASTPGATADAIKAVARERAAQENREAGAAAQPEDAPTLQPFVKDGEFDNVGRNDPCPCGSGKKFKQCHGK